MSASVNVEKIQAMTDLIEVKKVGIALYKALKIKSNESLKQKESYEQEFKQLKEQVESFQEMIQKLMSEKESREDQFAQFKETISHLQSQNEELTKKLNESEIKINGFHKLVRKMQKDKEPQTMQFESNSHFSIPPKENQDRTKKINDYVIESSKIDDANNNFSINGIPKEINQSGIDTSEKYTSEKDTLISNLQRQITIQNEENEKIKASLSELNNENEIKQRKIEELHQAYEKAIKEIEVSSLQILNLKETISNLQNNFDNEKNEKISNQSTIDSYIKEINSLKNSQLILQENLSNMKEQNQVLLVQQNVIKQKHEEEIKLLNDKYLKNSQELALNIDLLKTMKSQLNKEINEKESKITELKNLNEQLTNTSNQYKANLKLLDEKEKQISLLSSQTSKEKDLLNDFQKISSENQELLLQLQERDTKIADLQSMVQNSKENENKISFLQQNLETQIKQTKEISTEFQTYKEQKENDLILLTNEKQKLFDDNQSLTDEILILKSHKEENETTIKKFEKLTQQQHNQIQEETLHNKDLTSKLDEANEMIQKLQSDQGRQSIKIHQLEEEKDNILLEKEQITKDKDEKVSELEGENNNLESVLKDKEQTINKLKTLLTKYAKSDAQKQEIISNYQSQIENLNEDREKIESTPKYSLPEVIVLERKIEQLEQEINQNQSSKTLQEKNQKLQDMLQKSSALYIEMQEKLDQTEKELEMIKHKVYHFKIEQLPESTIFIKEKKVNKKEESRVLLSYLKSILIQFFVQDEDTQTSLIPMILDLLNCSEQQISACMRQWKRSKQLISKTSGFFGI